MNISHLKRLDSEQPDSEWRLQSNEEHSRNVSLLCKRFASEFDCDSWGEALGLLHDLGKECIGFQNYIRGKSGYKPELTNSPRTKHAYIGAIAARQLLPEGAPVLSYCILGHHSGLSDCGELKKSLEDPIPTDVIINSYAGSPLSLPFQPGNKEFHLWIRMLFSCLVDADRLDTELFMNENQARLRRNRKELCELLPLLENYLQQLKVRSADTVVNRIRYEVQKECMDASPMPPGFFSLTVPTGGGKTLSSLLWAMKHALKHGKRRIIIAIPYTSIIVQTAQTLRTIFGKENVLEHHSNTDIDNEEYSVVAEQMKLVAENWDAPIIVTTNVQLFESLFSNKPSKCRKLHNICNSVLILDEVQTLPLPFLSPIIDSLKTLQCRFGVSVLFTTASQPAIDNDVRYGKRTGDSFEGIHNIHEIMSTPVKLSDQLRRAQIHIDTESSGYDDIAGRIMQHPRVLCILNTRSDAKEIYERLSEPENTYHLSRMMCPVHIRKTLDDIKVKLKSETEPAIRVVATQLIEAGVDIDFPVVFRQEAGLDSIIQAAGRCNREGKLKIGDTFVFHFDKPLPPGYISHAAGAMNRLAKDSDWFEPEVMKLYFKQLYGTMDTFDKAQIKDRLYKVPDFYFKTAAEEFKLIDDNGIGIIVNYENSSELIECLKQDGPSYSLMKRLNQYTVNIREWDFKKLRSDRLIEEVIEGVYWLPDREQYDVKKGLVTDNHWLDELLVK